MIMKPNGILSFDFSKDMQAKVKDLFEFFIK